MILFIFTESIVLLIIIGLLLILSGVWPPDSPWAPWWQMPEKVIAKMCKMANISSKDVVYDLGCGTAHAIICATSRYGAKAVGIEIDPMRYWIAKWNVLQSKQGKYITLLKKNFFDVNLSGATVIFVYLVPSALKRLAPKFLKELKSGTKFLSYVYPMPQALFKGKLKLVKHDTQMRIYYYKLLS